jgi:hypothetical protein
MLNVQALLSLSSTWAHCLASKQCYKCRYYSSIHPHGVLYDKGSEGAPYSDGSSSSEKGDDAVAPNATYIYTWKVSFWLKIDRNGC